MKKGVKKSQKDLKIWLPPVGGNLKIWRFEDLRIWEFAVLAIASTFAAPAFGFGPPLADAAPVGAFTIGPPRRIRT